MRRKECSAARLAIQRWGVIAAPGLAFLFWVALVFGILIAPAFRAMEESREMAATSLAPAS